MKLTNNGIINIGNNNQNTVNTYLKKQMVLVEEFTILKENTKDPIDRDLIEKIIKNIKTQKEEANKSLFKKISKKTLELIEKLSLTLIAEYLKSFLK